MSPPDKTNKPGFESGSETVSSRPHVLTQSITGTSLQLRLKCWLFRGACRFNIYLIYNHRPLAPLARAIANTRRHPASTHRALLPRQVRLLSFLLKRDREEKLLAPKSRNDFFFSCFKWLEHFSAG